MSKVTIVGAGLVGSLLSIFLAKRGHHVTVFERRPDPRSTDVYAGRSINLVVSHRGWTALRAAGIEDAVRAITVPVFARMTHDRDGTLNRLPYSIDNQAIDAVSRGELNRRLLTEAEKLPNVNVRFEHECVDVDLVSARSVFKHKETATVENADVVFGCDGASSAVRQKMMHGRFNYSQEFLEHDYKQVVFPANSDGSPKMDPQCLQIWPRRFFMMMGLANQDGTFTGTLFLPNSHTEEYPGFDTVRTEAEATAFFSEYFADVLPLVPDLLEQYLHNPQSTLTVIRCDPWQVNGTAALVGDAAHAVVPFYGEGMNAGYEDCRVLNELLDEFGDDNWREVLERYATSRKPQGDAIAELSLRNFVEMRDLVADPTFLLRKKIEARLQSKHPDQWIPLYSQVKFSNIPYLDAWNEGLRQDRIMEQVLAMPGVEERWDSEEVERMALKLAATL